MEAWGDYIKLVSWIFSNNNIKFTDDDSQNCYILFTKCQKNYDAEKSGFKTYLAHSINNYIKLKKSKEYDKKKRECVCIDDMYCCFDNKENYRWVIKKVLAVVMQRKEKRHFKMFYRRNYLGQSISYIGELYGLSNKIVYTRIDRAKVSLRKILNSETIDSSIFD